MHYHKPKDLADSPSIGEWSTGRDKNNPGYYGEDTGSGKRTRQDQPSLEVTLAKSPNNPSCMDSCITKAPSAGSTRRM